MESSSLIARRLAPFSVRLCASPDLIEKHGPPKQPQDLSKLPCIIDTNTRYLANWPFCNDAGETISVTVSGPMEVNSPLAARAAAISGLGYALLPDFIAGPAIEAGTLVSVLDDRVPRDGGIFVVYPHRRYLPAKVRALVDFLAAWFKAREAQTAKGKADAS
jgi:DNA-binding transcriptional LysR family regulator